MNKKITSFPLFLTRQTEKVERLIPLSIRLLYDSWVNAIMGHRVDIEDEGTIVKKYYRRQSSKRIVVTDKNGNLLRKKRQRYYSEVVYCFDKNGKILSRELVRNIYKNEGRLVVGDIEEQVSSHNFHFY